MSKPYRVGEGDYWDGRGRTIRFVVPPPKELAEVLRGWDRKLLDWAEKTSRLCEDLPTSEQTENV